MEQNEIKVRLDVSNTLALVHCLEAVDAGYGCVLAVGCRHEVGGGLGSQGGDSSGVVNTVVQRLGAP